MRRITLTGLLVGALLATSVGTPANAAYVGSDGRIAFVRANQIFTINADRTGVDRVTHAGKNYRPHWSPDGQRIAFIHEGSDDVPELWIMRANGTGKSQVTVGADVTAGPSWSPDGAWLAFAGADGLLAKVSTTAPYGAPVPLLGFFTGCEGCDPVDPTPVPIPVDRWLAWSPDGTRIAVFNHFDGRLDDAIYWYDVATGEAKWVDGIGGDCCGNADWSDLAWGTQDPNQFGFGEVLFGEDPTGPAVSKTIVFPDPFVGSSSPAFVSVEGDKSPAPSPSGLFMALTNRASGVAKLYVANADGSERRLLTHRGYQADWQPLP